jgi:hypothetical protein
MNYWVGHVAKGVHNHSMSDRPEYGNCVIDVDGPWAYWTCFLVHFQ